MNMEEAMELCRQEYEKEREHAASGRNILPSIPIPL